MTRGGGVDLGEWRGDVEEEKVGLVDKFESGDIEKRRVN
jgi:hypothetical protein